MMNIETADPLDWLNTIDTVFARSSWRSRETITAATGEHWPAKSTPSISIANQNITQR
jgi:hypothetical protein